MQQMHTEIAPHSTQLKQFNNLAQPSGPGSVCKGASCWNVKQNF